MEKVKEITTESIIQDSLTTTPPDAMVAGDIYTKIPLIMGEIGYIEKTRKNPQQGYSFRGIDDIYASCQLVLSKHGVFCSPTVIDVKRETRTTHAGGILTYTIMTIVYRFYASDGSYIDTTVIGEAMDTSDKSCNKAMSAAQKYAFLQIFCIPTSEPKDTELETHEVTDKTDTKVTPPVTSIPPTPPTRNGANKPTTITDEQISEIYDLAGKSKYTNEDIKKYMADTYKISAIKLMPQENVEIFKQWLKDGQVK